MTEIRFDVDLDYPCERVWLALTDPREFDGWFLPTERDPADRTRLRLHPDRLDGFHGPVDVDIIDTTAPTTLVMRWQGEDLQVRVVVTLAPVAGGCRLTFVQRGFLGRRGTLRRLVLRTTYGRLFGERLPRELDRLAGQEPTVAIAAKVPPPGNARAPSRLSTGRRNDRGFPGRRIRRFDLVRAAGPTPTGGGVVSTGKRGGAHSSIRGGVHSEARGDAHSGARRVASSGTHGVAVSGARGTAPSGARGVAGSGVRAVTQSGPRGVAHPGPRGVAHPGPRGVGRAGTGGVVLSRARGVAGIARAAVGRVAAPPGSAWPTAKPAGTRHRSLAVPYRGGGSTRSIRRLVSVRSITDGRAARGRSAGIGRLTGRHRTAIMIMVVAALATLAVVSPRIVAWRQAEATRPQVGGAAQPPPGFAAGPGGSGPAVLVGSYRTVSSAPGGYRGEVTVRNVGDVGVDDWTVTITLPLPGQVVTGGRGARYRQSGRTVAFTPADGAGPVGPRGLLRVEFTVSGAGPPIGCTLDGRPCEGVSG